MRFWKRTTSERPIRATCDQAAAGGARQGGGTLSVSLQDNMARIRSALGDSTDLTMREFRIGPSGSARAAIAYTDGLADHAMINRFMESLLLNAGKPAPEAGDESSESAMAWMSRFVPMLGSPIRISDFGGLFAKLLAGDSVILVDGYDYALAVGTKGWEDRGVQEASAQTVVRGPRESFTENIRTNTALIRRKINDPRLWLETRPIGEATKTSVAIMYMKGIANDDIVEEVRRRLGRIEIDGILESGNIEELIQDETITPFPTVYNTERPDAVAANLLEGRVAILVDGTPIVLLVPVIFTQFFQSPEDYYQRSDFGLLRMLRVVSFFITLLAPSLFIAVTTFHQEMLPTTLMMSIAAQRERVPFPAAVEAYMMEFTFELLREAGIRMPRAVGPAISIVGALVLGEAAVQAGFVSPAMVIVVSITAIASFVFPSFSMSIPVRMLRFVLMALAASFGLYGIFIGMMILGAHLCSLRSFGVPYMSPLAPMNADDQKDTILRLPLWRMSTRPNRIGGDNVVRERTPPPEPDPPQPNRSRKTGD
ncbi:spore germination protein [Paenibacillus flagellatus]|uniref:Spore germination protein n=1 Tax=Paenibacillus flagellatus TaxID=2211139 RepID=A0A2V5K6B8_9BACL|nr:spore germination protein [Paenibacillus flagellatus]PYI54949.1 spore germination protein [Paenibacillus flagellatus]